MTTVDELINRTLHGYLHVGASAARNKLAAGIDASIETLTLSYPLATLQAGSRLSIDLEDFHVWQATTSPLGADVERGSYGSAAAAHSTGAVVQVDASYTPAMVLDALNATISSLVSEGIFQVGSVNLTVSAGSVGYDLTDSVNVLKVFEAETSSPVASTKEWSRFDHFNELLNADTSIFPSGTAVQLERLPAPGTTLRVHYRHELSASLSALDDVVETVAGLESDAMDLLCIGAALHLTAGREPARNEIGAGHNRRPDDVPAGAWTQAPSNLRRLFNDRVAAERARLARKYPERLSLKSPLTSRR